MELSGEALGDWKEEGEMLRREEVGFWVGRGYGWDGRDGLRGWKSGGGRGLGARVVFTRD